MGICCVDLVVLKQKMEDPKSVYNQIAGSDQRAAWTHLVLHEWAHVILESTIYYDVGDQGWPGMHRVGEWLNILGPNDWRLGAYQNADLVTAAALAIKNRGLDPINELLADCMAEQAFPQVQGGYWIQYLGFGCTQSGQDAALAIREGRPR